MNLSVEISNPNHPIVLFIDRTRPDHTVTVDIPADDRSEGRAVTIYFDTIDKLIAWLTSAFDQVAEMVEAPVPPAPEARLTHLKLVPLS